MAPCKTITFRPTPEASEALAKLVEQYGDRSKAINAALVIAEAPYRDKRIAASSPQEPAAVRPKSKPPARTAKQTSRRSKTNATIAPPPNATGGHMLRRPIPKPSWKHG